MAHSERIEIKVTYHVGKSNRNSKTFQLRKPKPPLEKDIQVHRNNSTALAQPIAITKCIKFILTVTMKKTIKRNVCSL
ncbi:hypothetical protein T03_2042 [Trichinella britovi]|uniref:Uncharacterized protein n=1 Tax=Trichinella britovi TaxID=45882 RepID=A0A0V1C2Z7_TRIBR|nr:hypothetical protein T03_2042 [Trichinella britovi]